MSDDNDLIRRGDALALPPYDGDGDPAGMFDHHIFAKLSDLRALPAVQVGVKPLEWDSHPDAEHDPSCNEHYGGGQNNLAGQNEYAVYPHPCAVGYFVLDVMGNRCDEDFPSIAAAKAAAQADYEARIRSALTVTPAPDAAKVAALVGAGEEMAKSIRGNYYLPGVATRWEAAIAAMKEG